MSVKNCFSIKGNTEPYFIHVKLAQFLACHALKHLACKYRDSPDSKVLVHPGNSTIEKTVLIGDCFSTEIRIYDFWDFKVPFFGS